MSIARDSDNQLIKAPEKGETSSGAASNGSISEVLSAIGEFTEAVGLIKQAISEIDGKKQSAKGEIEAKLGEINKERENAITAIQNEKNIAIAAIRNEKGAANVGGADSLTMVREPETIAASTAYGRSVSE